MVRSWQKRIFGGVCGGLSERTPFSPTLLRILFVVGTLLTGGALATVYLAWWWLLPADSPNRRIHGAGLGALFALLMLVLVVVGFFLRDSVFNPAGTSLYEPLLLLSLALVHFYRQFTLPSDARRAPFFALGLVLLACVPVIGASGVIPSGMYDTLIRSAPALLIFGGAYLLLRDRLSAPAGLLAGTLALVSVVGIATVAFNQRADQLRTENNIIHTQDIPSTVTLLVIDVETLDTDVEFFSAPTGTRTVNATFVGSDENTLTMTYSEGDSGIANLRFLEERTSPYPTLTAIGRARLQVELPMAIALAVTYGGERANATFDMSALNLERLNVDLARGDAVVSLPIYQPLSPSIAESPGRIALYEGNLRLIVPDEVSGRFVLNRDRSMRPTFIEGRYILIDDGADGTLQASNYDNADLQLRYTLSVPRGQIRVDNSAGTQAP